MTQKELKDRLRNSTFLAIGELLANADYEIMQVKSNEWAIPCVDEDNNEQTVIITVKVPNGSRDGEGYDPYEMAENYKVELAEKLEKKRVAEEKKAKKIAKDKSAKANKESTK